MVLEAGTATRNASHHAALPVRADGRKATADWLGYGLDFTCFRPDRLFALQEALKFSLQN